MPISLSRPYFTAFPEKIRNDSQIPFICQAPVTAAYNSFQVIDGVITFYYNPLIKENLSRFLINTVNLANEQCKNFHPDPVFNNGQDTAMFLANQPSFVNTIYEPVMHYALRVHHHNLSPINQSHVHISVGGDITPDYLNCFMKGFIMEQARFTNPRVPVIFHTNNINTCLARYPEYLKTFKPLNSEFTNITLPAEYQAWYYTDLIQSVKNGFYAEILQSFIVSTLHHGFGVPKDSSHNGLLIFKILMAFLTSPLEVSILLAGMTALRIHFQSHEPISFIRCIALVMSLYVSSIRLEATTLALAMMATLAGAKLGDVLGSHTAKGITATNRYIKGFFATQEQPPKDTQAQKAMDTIGDSQSSTKMKAD